MKKLLKEDLIKIHLNLFKVERAMESVGITNDYFILYDELGVFPCHIHKHKTEHIEAIILLCLGILEAIHEKPEIVTPEKSIELTKLVNLTKAAVK